MRLTPVLLEAAYVFLRATPPFRRWALPESCDVEFRVSKDREALGSHQLHSRQGHHVITISGVRVSHLMTLMSVTAHEMLHLYQAESGEETKSEHNADFRRLSKIVCRYHGWDPLEF